MKIICEFCKTEYTLAAAPAVPVQCAVCGHTWRTQTPRRRNPALVLFAALCALLAAGIFAFVIITHNDITDARKNPVVAKISAIHTVVDAFDVPHFVVNGTVTNQSDEIYGVPDLIITSYDEHGNITAQQKFMPTATLLDAGAYVTFTHTLSAPTNGVKKITAELKE